MQNSNLTNNTIAFRTLLKQFAKKILKPIGIWGILSSLRVRYYSSARHRRARKFAREFAPLYGKSKFIYLPSYSSDNENLQKISQSQYGQELFLFERIFDGGSGTFIEIGANDPIRISNSYALEKLGWIGISFEPISHLCKKWETERTTKCYPYVIGDEEGWVDFKEVNFNGKGTFGASSVVGYSRVEDVHPYEITKKQMRKLENILKEHNIESIDILFIDVEGFEMNVLKGLDFKKVNIKSICVENVAENTESYDVRYLLQSKGYELMAHIGGDDIFWHGGRIKWNQ